ncbi:hypothetical protein LSH36_303g02045 [Paralvinella palmiformis]|uniref:PH domain-containing protein n=1 Tax=Paralvinella palmiformis TaxID=53620 RepID=A0AAD9N2P0_9ANNE|nr:hypothetical protein LSH36_303g02045 [Paralvinella palmiformis]
MIIIAFFADRKSVNMSSSTDEENNKLLDNKSDHKTGDDNMLAERQWSDLVTIPLLCAFITRFKPGSEELCCHIIYHTHSHPIAKAGSHERDPCNFEVVGVNGETTGLIECDSGETANDWLHTIQATINTLNSQAILLTNKSLLPHEHVVHMCWVCERVGVSKLWRAWKRKFLAFKGSDICFFETPPVHGIDWSESDFTYKICSCMLKINKEIECTNLRTLLYTIHAFLSAKLASVDPNFLLNL